MPDGHTRTPGNPDRSAGGPEPDHFPGGAVEVNASYAGEWALFEHYCAATEQTALPASAATVEAFLTAVPGRPATLARRRRAIAAAHRRAGLSAEHLQLDTSGACSAAFFERQQRRDGAGDLIAVCPTRGWPTGLTGRRDGFLVVLIEVLGHTRERASRLTPAEITLSDGRVTIAGRAVPEGTDPRSCPGCAVGRWLEVCDLGDGLGQAIGRRLLTSTAPATPDSPPPRPPAGPPAVAADPMADDRRRPARLDP